MIYLILFLFYFIEIECGLVFIATSKSLFTKYATNTRNDAESERRSFVNTVVSIADVPNRQTLYFSSSSDSLSTNLRDKLGYQHSIPKLTLQNAVQDNHIFAINNTE